MELSIVSVRSPFVLRTLLLNEETRVTTVTPNLTFSPSGTSPPGLPKFHASGSGEEAVAVSRGQSQGGQGSHNRYCRSVA